MVKWKCKDQNGKKLKCRDQKCICAYHLFYCGGAASTRGRRYLDTCCLSFVYIFTCMVLWIIFWYLCFLCLICIVFIFYWTCILSIVGILNCLHIWMIITYCFDHCSHILYGCWLFGQVAFMHIFSYLLDCIVLVSYFLLLYLL